VSDGTGAQKPRLNHTFISNTFEHMSWTKAAHHTFRLSEDTVRGGDAADLMPGGEIDPCAGDATKSDN
jgi:hypothetical protein